MERTEVCLKSIIREKKIKKNIATLSQGPAQSYGKAGGIIWFCFKAYEQSVSQLHDKVQN